ncbi:hypothetical protein DN594_03190 [Enterobacter cloacae]|nr:hypothetical protein DN594_03190 [Enterobacter cloacae]
MIRKIRNSQKSDLRSRRYTINGKGIRRHKKHKKKNIYGYQKCLLLLEIFQVILFKTVRKRFF